MITVSVSVSSFFLLRIPRPLALVSWNRHLYCHRLSQRPALPVMSLLPPSIVLPSPFHHRQQSRSLRIDANEENAEPLLSKQLKQGAEVPDTVRVVSLIYLTMGFLSFLWLLGPGRPPFKATLWNCRGRHPRYFKRYEEGHNEDITRCGDSSR